jgi:hypothetical protein
MSTKDINFQTQTQVLEIAADPSSASASTLKLRLSKANGKVRCDIFPGTTTPITNAAANGWFYLNAIPVGYQPINDTYATSSVQVIGAGPILGGAVETKVLISLAEIDFFFNGPIALNSANLIGGGITIPAAMVGGGAFMSLNTFFWETNQ